jgi:exodeoxyribonuclease VII small subunit
MSKSNEKLSYEEAFNRLQETSARLEQGSLTLDQSLALYEEGVALARHCRELLEQAELRLTQIAPGQPAQEEEAVTEIEDDDFI